MLTFISQISLMYELLLMADLRQLRNPKCRTT